MRLSLSLAPSMAMGCDTEPRVALGLSAFFPALSEMSPGVLRTPIERVASRGNAHPEVYIFDTVANNPFHEQGNPNCRTVGTRVMITVWVAKILRWRTRFRQNCAQRTIPPETGFVRLATHPFLSSAPFFSVRRRTKCFRDYARFAAGTATTLYYK